MKATFVTMLLLLSVLTAKPASAAHRKLTAVPRAVSRTTMNMVTFRNKTAAVEEWGSLAVWVAAGVVSAHAQNVVDGEHTIIGRFGYPEALAIVVPTGFMESTITQYGHELGVPRYQSAVPLIASGIIGAVSIATNESTLRVDCEVSRLSCR